MEIALINSSAGITPSTSQDLRDAILKLGHTPMDFCIDRAVVRMGASGISVTQAQGRSQGAKVASDAALLRSIGIIRDYEQFEQRVWAVRALEMCGTCVMNRIEEWIPAGDKFSTTLTLAKAGLPVPETVSTEDLFMAYEAAKAFRDSVIKPLRGGMGLGVFRLEDPDAAMHVFNAFTSLNKPIYVQRFLEKTNSGDYRVIVVGDEAIGAEFRSGKGWKTNLSQGATPSKARLTPELSELAVKATRAMGLEFAGVDIAETKDGYFILETNPSITWAGFKEVTGIDPAERIVRHLIGKARR